MFDWFKNIGRREYPTWADVPPPTDMEKIADDMSKVVPFPERDLAVPPAAEKPAVTFYRLGLTDNSRVSLQMGYSEITMNKQGVQNLIDQLELFKTQLVEEEEN